MYQNPENQSKVARARSGRRGAVAVYVAVCGVVIIGMAALAVDVGMLYAAQAEMQRCADAAALASTNALLSEDRVFGGAYLDALEADARYAGTYVAGANIVHNAAPIIREGDIEIGYLSSLDFGSAMTLSSVAPANATRVSVRRDSSRGGSIALFFARIFGAASRDLDAMATAAFEDGIVGYRVTDRTGNADLLPFTLQVEYWNGLLAGTHTSGDHYSYDPETGVVSPGPDGILELNLYPGAGSNQLPPGNFGTVDIGSPNNSAADLARQILHGISQSDLAWFGGEIRLGPDGTLLLNGDTGLSAGVKDELEAIKGQPRAIPIFSTVAGPGNNAMFTIVKFGGIRIMNVRLTGKMSSKEVIIQPAVVIDDAVLADAGPGPSDYVYSPVRLVE